MMTSQHQKPASSETKNEASRSDGGEYARHDDANLQTTRKRTSGGQLSTTTVLQTRSDRTIVTKLLLMLDASQKVNRVASSERRQQRKLLRMLSKSRDAKLKMDDANRKAIKKVKEQEREHFELHRFWKQTLKDNEGKIARLEKTISSMKDLHTEQIKRLKFKEIELVEAKMKEKIRIERQLKEAKEMYQTENTSNQELRLRFENYKSEMTKQSEASQLRARWDQHLSHGETENEESLLRLKSLEEEYDSYRKSQRSEMEKWKALIREVKEDCEKKDRKISNLSESYQELVQYSEERQESFDLQLVDVKNEHSREIDLLKRKLRESEEKYARSQEQTFELRTIGDEGLEQGTKKKQVFDRQQTEMKSMHSKEIDSFKEQLRQSGGKISELQASHAEAMEEAKKEKEVFDQQLTHLKNQHTKEMKSWKGQLKEVEEKCSKAQEELSKLRTSRDEEVDQAKKEKQVFEEHLTDMKNQHARDANFLNGQMQEVEEKYSRAQDEISRLQISRAEEVDQAKRQKQAFEQQLTDMKDQQSKEIDSWKAQLQAEKEKCAMTKGKISKLQAIQDEAVAKATKEKEEFYQQLSDMKNLHSKEIDSWKEQLQETKEKYTEAERKTIELQDSHDEMVGKMEKGIQASDQEMIEVKNQHSKEIDSLKDQVQEAEEKYGRLQDEISKLRTSRDEVADEAMDQAKKEKQSFDQQLADTKNQHSKEVESWKAKLQAADEKCAMADGRISELQVSLAEGQTKKEKQQLTNVKSVHSKEIDSFKEQLRQSEGKIAELQSSHAEAMEQAKKEKELFDQQLTDLKNQHLTAMATLKEQLREANDLSTMAEGQISELQANYDAAVEKSKAFDQELIDTKKRHSKAIDVLKEELDSDERSFPSQSIRELGIMDSVLVEKDNEGGEDVYVKQQALLEGISSESNSIAGYVETTSAMDAIGNAILEEGSIGIENENLEIDELRVRCEFLEHDRLELARITSEILQMEREAHKLKVDAAVAAAQSRSMEDFQIFQQRTHQQMKSLYLSLCTDCRQRIDTAT